jgi:hypothetical protein
MSSKINRQDLSEAGEKDIKLSPLNDILAAQTQRVVSVDALRGFNFIWILGGDGAIRAVAVMTHDKEPALRAIGGFLGTQLRHSGREGFTFYDFIFPLFIFIAGVAIVLSLPRLVEREGLGRAHLRVLRRALLLYMLGLIYYGGIMNGWAAADWHLLFFCRVDVPQFQSARADCWFRRAVFAGLLLRHIKLKPQQKSLLLIGGGIVLVLAGYLWALQFPIIKQIWTSSYVLVAGGYSAILLGAEQASADRRQRAQQAFRVAGLVPQPAGQVVQVDPVGEVLIRAEMAGADSRHRFLPGYRRVGLEERGGASPRLDRRQRDHALFIYGVFHFERIARRIGHGDVAYFFDGAVIPSPIDQNPCAHWRNPIDMMRQG